MTNLRYLLLGTALVAGFLTHAPSNADPASNEGDADNATEAEPKVILKDLPGFFPGADNYKADPYIRAAAILQKMNGSKLIAAGNLRVWDTSTGKQLPWDTEKR